MRTIGQALGVALLLAAGAWNLIGAEKIATGAGTSLAAVVRLWIRGYDANAMYPGRILLVIDRIETGFLILAALVVWGVCAHAIQLAEHRAVKKRRHGALKPQ